MPKHDDDYMPQADYFMPSAFTVGPDGNISAVQSSDYQPFGAVGFRLYDSVSAQTNPAFLSFSEGGLDANTVMATNLILLNPAVATMPAMLGQLAAYDLGNGERWLFLCHNVVDNGATWDISWAFIGGPWIHARILGTITPNSVPYPVSPGISIPVFFDGTYDIKAGARQQNTNAGGAFQAFCVGGSTPDASTELLTYQDPTEAIYQEIAWPRFTINGGTAGVWYRSPSGVNINYAYRSISILPRTIETTVPAP